MLEISTDELLSEFYPRQGNGVFPPNRELLSRAVTLANGAAEPRSVVSVFDLSVSGDTVTFCGSALKAPSNDLTRHIGAAQKAALVAATVGHRFDRTARELAAKGDTALSVVFDQCGLLLVEKLLDSIEKELSTSYALAATRYSAGYGDFSIELQGTILETLQAKKLAGIYLTGGGMMSPMKSVTAVIALKPIGAL